MRQVIKDSKQRALLVIMWSRERAMGLKRGENSGSSVCSIEQLIHSERAVRDSNAWRETKKKIEREEVRIEYSI